MKKISRRDFLKLGLGFFEAVLASNLVPDAVQANKSQNSQPNIVLLVCDAMTAQNLSVYDYQRKTTPNLEKMAERAIVYHNHHAGGNFTPPGNCFTLNWIILVDTQGGCSWGNC